jgi:DNA end-binding protein Ku
MTRPVWSGAIQFALITIAVKLHKANKDGDVHFKNVHAVCHSQLKQKKWCPVCNVEVLATDLNKAFALSKDKMIEFSEAELEAISIENNQQIIIERAVGSEEISPAALDTFYYLQPEKFSEHVYSLLAQVLMLKKQVLIGKFIMRSKEHLVAIKYHEGGLLLTTLHWSDEVHTIAPLLPAAQTIPEQEVQLATML